MSQCLFCNIDREILAKNHNAFAIYDHYPVAKGHILVIPKRHIENIFDASKDEIIAIYELILRCKDILFRNFKPNGYNIGTNVGIAGGQSIFHFHVHLIPRYNGDVEQPLGGIRNIVTYKCPHTNK